MTWPGVMRSGLVMLGFAAKMAATVVPCVDAILVSVLPATTE